MAARKKSSSARKPAIQRHQGHGQHPSFDIPNPIGGAAKAVKAIGSYVHDVFSPSTYISPTKEKRARQIRATNTAANKVTEKVYSNVGGKQFFGDYWAPSASGKAKAVAETAAWFIPVGKAFKVVDKLQAGEGAGKLARAGVKTLRGLGKTAASTAIFAAYDKGTSSAIRGASAAFEKKKPKTGGTRRPTVKKKGK